MKDQTYEDFIRDTIYLIRERGATATEAFRHSSSKFDEGRDVAFREVLAMLQSQAHAFGIDPATVCLDGFDPLRDSLAPPSSS